MPVSIEELKALQVQKKEASKPKFISKAKRAEMAAKAKQIQKNTTSEETTLKDIRSTTDLKRSVVQETVETTKPLPSKPKPKSTSGKFSFDWSAADDTSKAYQPSYSIDSGDGQVPKRQKRDLEDAHWSDKPVESMTSRDWRIFKEDYSIVTKGGGNIPNPLRSWNECKEIPGIVRDTISRMGYKEPTPIQRAAIPIALGIRDVIGVAETGSGKTASFLIPLISYICELPKLDERSKVNGPYGLILAPTRELAMQIKDEAVKFCAPLGFKVVSVVGGYSAQEQALAVQEGAELIVATPGRLLDVIDRRLLVLNQCCYVVMDEADRMVDMGFEEQVQKVLASLPSSNAKPDSDEAENLAAVSTRRYRQTMMYTATMPVAIEKLAKKYLRRPGIVTIGSAGQAGSTVTQLVEFLNTDEKRKRRLLDIISKRQYRPPIVVFLNYKRDCEAVSDALVAAGWRTAIIHGGKQQEQREQAVQHLKRGAVDVLVATDVAGRGLDIPNVSLVVNFQMANNIESYTHRIGRTGRAGKRGTAVTFLGQEDDDVLFELKQMISRSEASPNNQELSRHPAARMKKLQQ
ncbi:Pre-mRNA-splicing ATP-dependent RNA helicase PRP28 [Yarrowia lipolytica]|uniref:Pre-mRNA-splicing ATP-dependent RNA helicase PRP28 n=2 Tax=Yarrowia lipolytica TaxID=4952 RepID=PRP28_YARLI|nr:YALI0F28391p [Yarrowia lipolytica CLIB122]Q6C024.1 RecName: Full=Pre-mRNA-splicing ATP-dependent RNA helicase PRP28 [Yarrowia lipolytica CLIB122]AOW07833.1 hypothetical protein YALI1_F36127g [Yarrowia lipolytica]KAB8280528.1 Pre-mRNA-splicing ATP-dependent RNA helicase PRP28 [Yarrowia lipolytica]KAE8168874.1 Pre-mRNA-splicing ATP-dependent RNA helicase PRP28 [Yarrowia lipolytica]KAJ8055124.1 Pre-mRNA-splicing ATP-dependent RNA helicase PRP28 [Yarrowia lipolytica]RDW23372.1 Pre-mRNA-splicin|eukprot:XP_505988.1 YALI0F28391p [Yarrowia lipolytica CLIB122]